MAQRRAALLLLLAASAAATSNTGLNQKHLVKIGDGQCNGGVGGIGEHYCTYGGTCNEGGTPLKPPTQSGTGCPGAQEHLLCEESAGNSLQSCRAQCEGESSCVGFMVSWHAAKGKGRCELHTKVIEFASKPLECYVLSGSSFTLIGKGACRTKLVTVGGPQSGTHYGNMQVEWVKDLAECEKKCRDSTPTCFGVEYHRTPTDTGNKCEVHFEELSASQMSIFECWSLPNCHNAHNCGQAKRKANSLGTSCTPSSSPGGGLPSCSDNLCCQTLLADVSGAARWSLGPAAGAAAVAVAAVALMPSASARLA